METTPTYHPPKGDERETTVEHGLPLWKRTRGRILLAATEPFSHMGEPLCGGM